MSVVGFHPVDDALHGTVAVPGSKSVSNRALVCASLAGGSSTITGLADGDDTTRMVIGLGVLGADIGHEGTTALVRAGIRPERRGEVTIDAGLAGTTSRFLTAVAALRGSATVITGAPSLRKRPMAELHDLLRQMGADVSSIDGRLPVTVSRGALFVADSTDDEATRSVAPIVLHARGDVSSQFVSAVMMIAPLCGGVVVRLSGDVVSRSYLSMTAEVMRAFGVSCRMSSEEILVPHGAYRGTDFVVDADWSSASYPFAAVAIIGGTVRVDGLRASSSQPEAGFAAVLERMGCEVNADERGVVVSRDGAHALCGIDVDMSEMSDLVPTLAVLGASAVGTTRIRGVGFIRAKESDRLGDLATELRACGTDVVVEDDGLTIHPGPMRSATLRTHHDHRLAMSLALLSLRTKGITVDDPTVVAKSWPTFWEAMRVGLRLRTVS